MDEEEININGYIIKINTQGVNKIYNINTLREKVKEEIQILQNIDIQILENKKGKFAVDFLYWLIERAQKVINDINLNEHEAYSVLKYGEVLINEMN